VQLRMNLAVVFIMLMLPMDGKLAQIRRRDGRGRSLGLIIEPIFQFVRPVMNVFERTAANEEKGAQKRICCERTHEIQFSPNASHCQEEMP